jgi:hypothetical protein
VPRRASLPEGKSLFFRRTADDNEPDVASSAETTEPAAPPADEAAPTRPPTARAPGRRDAGGATRQSAIFLEERHLDWLDDKCREARQRGGRAIRKALIIRALLDVAMESPVDLTSLRKEEELVDRVRRGLRGA